MDDDLTTADSASVTPSGADDLGVGHKPWFLVVASGFIGCALILINIWIILSIIISPNLHTVSNILLASLSLANILVGIQNSWSGYMVSDLSKKHPILHIEVFAACLHLVVGCYLLNSLAIAADRYFKVSRPMQYIRLVSMKKSAFVLILVWGLSAAFGMLIFTLLRTQPTKPERAAISIMVEDQSFQITMIYLMNATLLPTILAITVFTVGLTHIARRQQQRVKQEMLTLAHLRPNQLNTEQHSGSHPSSPNHLPGNIHLKTTQQTHKCVCVTPPPPAPYTKLECSLILPNRAQFH